jgi:hypothetical protein
LASHPFVHLQKLEPKQSSDAVNGQPALFNPPIHGIDADAEVLGGLLNASPAVVHDRLLCLHLRVKAEISLSNRTTRREM